MNDSPIADWRSAASGSRAETEHDLDGVPAASARLTRSDTALHAPRPVHARHHVPGRSISDCEATFALTSRCLQNPAKGVDFEVAGFTRVSLPILRHAFSWTPSPSPIHGRRAQKPTRPSSWRRSVVG